MSTFNVCWEIGWCYSIVPQKSEIKEYSLHTENKKKIEYGLITQPLLTCMLNKL